MIVINSKPNELTPLMGSYNLWHQANDGTVQLVSCKRLLQENICPIIKGYIFGRAIVTRDHDDFCGWRIGLNVINKINSKPIGKLVIKNDDRRLFFL